MHFNLLQSSLSISNAVVLRGNLGSSLRSAIRTAVLQMDNMAYVLFRGTDFSSMSR